jgi:hypothetical protein
VTILICDKADFKATVVRGDKGNLILMKVVIYPKDRTILNIYALSIGILNIIKHITSDIKAQIHLNASIVSHLNTPLS